MRVATNLVVINLSTVEGEDRIERARALVRSSERAAQRAVGDGETP